MRAYKFLDDDGCSIYSGFTWPLPVGDTPGPWVEAEVHPCRTGIHGCPPADIAYWLSASLWEIELDGEVTASRHKVVAPRGRIVRRLDEYPVAIRELCALASFRARDRAVLLLRSEGRDDIADPLAAVDTIANLEAFGATLPAPLEQVSAGVRSAQMATDAAHYAPSGPLQHSPFISACSAGHQGADFDSGFAAERRFQSDWLAQRLAL